MSAATPAVAEHLPRRDERGVRDPVGLEAEASEVVRQGGFDKWSRRTHRDEQRQHRRQDDRQRNPQPEQIAPASKRAARG
jgi:hypothetical protein